VIPSLLRSRAQGDLLALLYLDPEREYSLTEAALLIGVSVKTVHTEASRAPGRRGATRIGWLGPSDRDEFDMHARCLRERMEVTRIRGQNVVSVRGQAYYRCVDHIRPAAGRQ
jgi:hypothetical protein